MKVDAQSLTIALFLCACSQERSEKSKSAEEPAGIEQETAVMEARSQSRDTLPWEQAVQTNPPREHIPIILENPTSKLPPNVIAALSSEDRPALLARYREEPELTNKLALTIALSFVGDEEVVQEFKRTLLGDPKGEYLTLREEEVILFTIEGLGLLARGHDSAFHFLTNAIDLRFWKENVRWKTAAGEGSLAGRALGALGCAQRPETDDVFSRIRKAPYISDGQGDGWALDSALLTGVFFRDLLAGKGLVYFKRIHGTEWISREYREWSGTENGKEWRQWAEQWRKNHPHEAGFLPPPK